MLFIVSTISTVIVVCIFSGIRDGKRRKILFQAYFKPRPISSLINQFWDGAVVRIKR